MKMSQLGPSNPSTKQRFWIKFKKQIFTIAIRFRLIVLKDLTGAG